MPEERIELSTYPLPRGCATTTLLRRSEAFSGWNLAGAEPIAHGKGPGKERNEGQIGTPDRKAGNGPEGQFEAAEGRGSQLGPGKGVPI